VSSNPDKHIALEEKIAFLEHTLEQLNQVVIEQDERLEGLQRKLLQFESRLAAQNQGQAPLADPLDEQPPHY